jgi:hypothetical protein
MVAPAERPWERPSAALVAPAFHAPHPLLPEIPFAPVLAGMRDFVNGAGAANPFWVITFTALADPAAPSVSYAVLDPIHNSQHGWVLRAAEVVQREGRWEWVQLAGGAYSIWCIKVEDKARVEGARMRGRQEHHVDNSLLDRALLVALRKGVLIF